jgi:transforming growth factor-beta-induced protein
LADILTYHVVGGAALFRSDLQDRDTFDTLNDETLLIGFEDDGTTLTVNNCIVSKPDVEAGNSVIHYIDRVLLPRDLVLPPSIVEIATNGDFPTLVAALQAANLVCTLLGGGPFTVFAPTEAAFANLPPGTIGTLLLPASQDLLVNILLQHVVLGEVKACDITDGMTVTALNGGTLTFTKTNAGIITVNGVLCEMTDIQALNGVVHVVNRVLLPNDDAMIPTISGINTLDAGDSQDSITSDSTDSGASNSNINTLDVGDSQDSITSDD